MWLLFSMLNKYLISSKLIMIVITVIITVITVGRGERREERGERRERRGGRVWLPGSSEILSSREREKLDISQLLFTEYKLMMKGFCLLSCLLLTLSVAVRAHQKNIKGWDLKKEGEGDRCKGSAEVKYEVKWWEEEHEASGRDGLFLHPRLSGVHSTASLSAFVDTGYCYKVNQIIG